MRVFSQINNCQQKQNKSKKQTKQKAEHFQYQKLTVFVVYKIARNPPVACSRDIGKLMPATESKTELPRKIINGTVRLQFSKVQVSQQSEPHIHTALTTLIL